MVANVIVSEVTDLRGMDEINRWDNRPFSGAWPGSKRDKPTDIKRSIKKKPKRARTAYTTEQLKALETIYTQNKYITSERRRDISKALNIADKSVKIWFQNRRMKEKRDSSESSSDSSNEASVSEMSPPSLPLTERYDSEQLKGKFNLDLAPFYSLESSQYQVPNFYNNHQNNEQFEFSLVSNNAAMGEMQFSVDNTVYPTQYYPPNDGGYFNENFYHQYQQNSNTMYNNYLNSTNNAMPDYFYQYYNY